MNNVMTVGNQGPGMYPGLISLMRETAKIVRMTENTIKTLPPSEKDRRTREFSGILVENTAKIQ